MGSQTQNDTQIRDFNNSIRFLQIEMHDGDVSVRFDRTGVLIVYVT